MLQTLEIENFRCFESVKLTNLGAINVIVGGNASGKTALLEAVYLLGATCPEPYLRTRFWRGLPAEMKFQGDLNPYDAVWREIFYKLDTNLSAVVSASTANKLVRSLRIVWQRESQVEYPLGGSSSPAANPQPVRFDYLFPDGQVTSTTAQHAWDRFVFPVLAPSNMHTIMLSGPSTTLGEDLAMHFSELSSRNESGKLVGLIRRLYPWVQDLSLELSLGKLALHAQVEGMPRRVPINFVSFGLTKIVALLLAILARENRVVLIDEIENGLYFETYPEAAQLIYEAVRLAGCQLFVTTHSAEFLQAVAALPLDQTSLRFFQTFRHDDGCSLRSTDAKTFSAAIRQGFELRKPA